MAMEDREIYELRRADGLHYLRDVPERADLAPASRARLQAFYGLLRRFRHRLGKDPLGDYIARLLKDSFLLDLCSAAYHQEQTVSNLLKFGRMALDAGDGRGTTLKEFIREVSRSIDEAVEEGESPLADEHLDAVRLLTIHKSKGLEYPVVFLPNLSASHRAGKDKKPVLQIGWEEGTAGVRLPRAGASDPAMALLEWQEEKRAELEWVRLLYVAMTRAKERLFLLGALDPGEKSAFSSLLSKSGAWPSAEEEMPSSLKINGFPCSVTAIDALSPIPLPSLQRSSQTSAVPKLKSLGLLWKKRYERQEAWRQAFVFASPASAQKEETGIFSEIKTGAGSISSSLVGQVCHRVLEGWDFEKGGNLGQEIERACLFLKSESPLFAWDAVARESESLLKGFLVSPAAQRLGQSEIMGRETPFLFAQEGEIRRGAVDLLFRHEGRLWVADYKTDHVASEQAALHSQRYADQGRAYVDAVQRILGERPGFQIIFLRTAQVIDLLS
jgi:ATP-dependent helicase/nuclease subunit A